MKKNKQQTSISPANIVVVLVFMIGILIAISLGVLGFLQSDKAESKPSFIGVDKGVVDSATVDEDAPKIVKSFEELLTFAPKAGYDMLNEKVLLPTLQAEYGENTSLKGIKDIEWEIIGDDNTIAKVRAYYRYESETEYGAGMCEANGPFTVHDLLSDKITLNDNKVTSLYRDAIADKDASVEVGKLLLTKHGLTIADTDEIYVNNDTIQDINFSNIGSTKVFYDAYKGYIAYILTTNCKSTIVDNVLGTSFNDKNTSNYVWCNPTFDNNGSLKDINLSFDVQYNTDNVRNVVCKLTFNNPLTPKMLVENNVNGYIIDVDYRITSTPDDYNIVADAIINKLGGKKTDRVYTTIAPATSDTLQDAIKITVVVMDNDEYMEYSLVTSKENSNTGKIKANIDNNRYENATTKCIIKLDNKALPTENMGTSAKVNVIKYSLVTDTTISTYETIVIDSKDIATLKANIEANALLSNIKTSETTRPQNILNKDKLNDLFIVG